MIVREDMHTHYTRVSFKDEFQNTVVHSKNANWNKILKRDFERLYSNTCVAFLFFSLSVFSLAGVYKTTEERLEREQRRFRTKMDKSRGKKWLAVTVTHLKNGWANGIVKEDSSIPFQISWRRFVGRFIYPQ
jgi:hypothetical protein